MRLLRVHTTDLKQQYRDKRIRRYSKGISPNQLVHLTNQVYNKANRSMKPGRKAVSSQKLEVIKSTNGETKKKRKSTTLLLSNFFEGLVTQFLGMGDNKRVFFGGIAIGSNYRGS